MLKCNEHGVEFQSQEDYLAHMRCHVNIGNCGGDEMPDEAEVVDASRTYTGLLPPAACPNCGEAATFQDATGVLWDSNAHHWRADSSYAPARSAKEASGEGPIASIQQR